MKRPLLFALLMLLASIMIFAPVRIPLAAQPSLPPQARKTLETAIDAWNSIYGERVRIKNWSYEKRISSPADLSQVRANLSQGRENLANPTQTWFPDINVSRPQEIAVYRLADVDSTQSQQIAAWRGEIAKIVKVGDHVARLTWLNGDREFSTLAITDSSTIIYDSMLSNAVLLQQRKGSFELRLGWIWEKNDPPEKWTRGLVSADVKPQCIKEAPRACLQSCFADLQLGEAKISCKTTKIKGSCQLDFSWAVATGFKKIKLGVDKFTLEVEGHLGSSAMGSDALLEKCKTLFTK